MITISRSYAKRLLKRSSLPLSLVNKGITIIMQKDDAERWLFHLESGKQKQIQNRLYDTHTKGFCCLGLEQSCNWGGKVETVDDGFGNIYVKEVPSFEYMDQTGKMYYDCHGLWAYAPELIADKGDYAGDYVAASALNDNGGYSFADIAKYIRNHIAVYE